MNFVNFKRCKTAILAILENLNFDFWRKFPILKCSKFPNLHFVTLRFYLKSMWQFQEVKICNFGHF